MNRGPLFRIKMKIAARVFLAFCRSYRISVANPEAITGLGGKNFVLAFWHGSMVVGWYLHRKLGMRALVSRSSDGDILASVLDDWGYHLIRGSSHRGGKEAMQTMIDEVRDGGRLVVTPDGPTGPPKAMKMGAVRAAQQAGVPLVCASIFAKKKYRLHSWDGFEIPVPFSQVNVQYIGPTEIDRSLDGETLTAKLREIESRWLTVDNQWR